MPSPARLAPPPGGPVGASGWVRLGAAGGTVAPPLFVCATVCVTVIDKPFVDASEWSAVHRSEVGWPSLVMLGPNGGVVIAALVACGALIVGLACALWRLADGRPARAASALLGIAGLAMCLVAFRQDPLGSEGPGSWHDRIHGAAYPVIPVAGALAAGLVWAGGRRRPGGRALTRVSLLTVAVAAPAFVLTGVDPIAQLARYPLFGSLLVWMEALAVTAVARARTTGVPRAGGPRAA